MSEQETDIIRRQNARAIKKKNKGKGKVIDFATCSGQHWINLVPNRLGWLLLFGAFWSLFGFFFKKTVAHPFYQIGNLVLYVLGIPSSPKLPFALILIFLSLLSFMRKRIIVPIMITMQAFFIGIEFLAYYVVEISDDWFWAELMFSLLSVSCSAAIIVIVWKARPAFLGRIHIVNALKALALSVISFVLLYVCAFFLLRVVSPPSISSRRILYWVEKRGLGELALRFQSPLEPKPHRFHPPAEIALNWSISIISAVIVFISIWIFFSGYKIKARTQAQDLHLRDLLIRYGHLDSLAYFSTRDNRLQVFSEDGEACVSYGVAMGVALAAGDPVGDPKSWPDAINAWLKHCYSEGLIPSVISCSDEGARYYRQAGMNINLMGDEAIIDTHKFDFSAPNSKPLVAALRRANREGIQFQIRRQADFSAKELDELRNAASLFREGEERGFSMSLDRMFAPQDSRQLIVTARDAEGRLQCLLTFVPWGTKGVSLNLMRRSRDSVNGVVEAMILTLIKQGQQSSIQFISLNFAMFRDIFVAGIAVDATLMDRIKRWLFLRASKVWQLESLHESNARYNPIWKPRYFCFPSDPLFALALIASGLLEGFLPNVRGLVPSVTPEWDVSASYLEELEELREGPTRQAMQEVKTTELQRVRLNKAQRLEELGIDPYPVGVKLGESVQQAVDRIADENISGQALRVHGRILARRNHGGVVFWDLYSHGVKLQVVLERNELPSAKWALMKLLDIGDIVVVEGTYGTSRTNTPSAICTNWQLVSKCLRPLPRLGTNLDTRLRARNRTLALLHDSTALQVIYDRSQIVSSVRQTLLGEGFLEVETPMLQAVQGGANARPFITHSNAYSTNMFLRIAPELYLKRLAVCGMEAIFEMGRSFRNEGADMTHNPEFTSLEAYRAGWDYNTMADLTEKLIKNAAKAVHGREVVYQPAADDEPAVCVVQGQRLKEIDISGPWPRVRVYEAVSQAVGEQIDANTSEEYLRALCEREGLEPPVSHEPGSAIGVLYDELVEEPTYRPTFYFDFPVATSPLTRQHRTQPGLAERWDLVAFGMELGTAYSELTDPREQRKRFTAQSLAAAAGDPEAMSLDEDFLQALDLGLKPTGGMGLGIDRLVMLITGTNIRQALAFPFVKPDSSGSQTL